MLMECVFEPWYEPWCGRWEPYSTGAHGELVNRSVQLCEWDPVKKEVHMALGGYYGKEAVASSVVNAFRNNLLIPRTLDDSTQTEGENK